LKIDANLDVFRAEKVVLVPAYSELGYSLRNFVDGTVKFFQLIPLLA